ncbi:hypothetical protein V2J09_006494 [Rumex salicifolius]
MQMAGATDLASSPQNITPAKSVEDFDDSPSTEMKIRCLCGSSLPTESMIQCEDPKCQIWQHFSCVIIPEKPTEGIPPVPSQFYCELCRLSRADPFCLSVANPLYPVNLIITSMPTDGTNPVQGIEKTFQITRSEKSWLSKPEYDVQAWCMLLNDKVLFRMQWPQYADLQVNGVAVRAINRPGSQLLGANGRDDGPIITQYTIDGINKISLTGCDSRLFCLGVRLLKRKNLEQILNIIPKETDGEPFEEALARVRRCVNGGHDTENADSDSDVEVVADSFTINLRCPMSGSRIKVAGRFRPCAHMGCFDLDTFVGMQQRSRKASTYTFFICILFLFNIKMPTWQCPICLKNYSLEHIVVDPYFNRVTTMMQSCEEDTTDIEVKPDGSWRVKSDSERWDLRQWHLPDGSIPHPSGVVVKSDPETSKAVKHESISLKLRIKKNSNRLWQVNQYGNMNTVSSSEGLQENRTSNGPNVIPINSGATGSGREGEDLSVNQEMNATFDFAVNNNVELDSMYLNIDQTYGFPIQTTSSPGRGADVIVLSDLDEENDNINHLIDGHVDSGGVSYSITPHGLPDTYQEDPNLGASGGLDLFSSADDDFGMSLWQLPSASQAGPSFQLFGSDAGVSDALVDLHPSSLNCPMPMNGYSTASDTAINPVGFVPDSSAGHFSNNDHNDSLVDNPMAFGGEDPSLQIFLPTKPSESSGHIGFQHQKEASSGIQNEDWISLRLGDGGGGNNGNAATAAQNGLNSEHLLHSDDGAMQSLAETGLFSVAFSF